MVPIVPETGNFRNDFPENYRNDIPERSVIPEQRSGNFPFTEKKSFRKSFRNSGFPEPFPQWKWKKFPDHFRT